MLLLPDFNNKQKCPPTTIQSLVVQYLQKVISHKVPTSFLNYLFGCNYMTYNLDLKVIAKDRSSRLHLFLLIIAVRKKKMTGVPEVIICQAQLIEIQFVI